MFKRRRFPVEITLLCVRWYCKYGISYRDLTEMMQERGVEVDPSTIMRWVHRYAPELEKRVRAYQGYGSTSWRVDETYVKVGGSWKYFSSARTQERPWPRQTGNQAVKAVLRIWLALTTGQRREQAPRSLPATYRQAVVLTRFVNTSAVGRSLFCMADEHDHRCLRHGAPRYRTSNVLM